MVTSRTASTRKTRLPQRANARNMRRDSTDAERKFWWLVRDRRFGGYKFKRQFLIGRYIVDFVCLEARLVVELDGGQHADRIAYDEIRDAYLKARGFQVFRFWNTEFLTNKDGVLEILLCQLKSPPHPSPLPQRGERG
ncbi:MAG TPA: endonuclease domain-containing protein [Rhizomicrobium sp.]|nr:endonuclease domain-containing protein [Rhizomicrobium sp.]